MEKRAIEPQAYTRWTPALDSDSVLWLQTLTLDSDPIVNDARAAW
jgi:hypothetical protein